MIFNSYLVGFKNNEITSNTYLRKNKRITIASFILILEHLNCMHTVNNNKIRVDLNISFLPKRDFIKRKLLDCLLFATTPVFLLDFFSVQIAE